MIRTVHVDLQERSYDIRIGPGLLERAVEYVPFNLAGRSVFVLYDQAVSTHANRLLSGLSGQAARIETLAVNGGEASKSYAMLETVLGWLLGHYPDRQSVLFVMGGGVVGDLGGLAASLVLRGIPFVQIPTTLLAQVDSSVGGKTGINTPQGKNLIGTFYQPAAVLCDTDTLTTLPEREVKAGYAEIVKYGLLGDAGFYDWLETHGSKILSLKPEPLMTAIEKSCAAKAAIVGDDERESKGGRRALLNLGHTFGHALEAAAGYDGRLLHGEAVAIGMALAFRLSARMGLCPAGDAGRMERSLSQLGLKTEISQIVPRLKCSADDLVALMAHDKKSAGGKIAFILVRAIGDAFQSSDVDMALVREIVEESLSA